ncbi:MAG TPA: hypothetical protein GX521_04210 [Firmicutes bacterium]|nr:hypothetical protein [Bacillota bacterium]
MGYQEQLREAREILQKEIKELHDNLASKEFALRKIDGILKGSGSGRGRRPSLTSQIVEALYSLSKEHERGVPAKAVIEEFAGRRQDVNPSTIRSTLYQVTRKLRPTEIAVGEGIKQVRVLKDGPLYDVELVSAQQAEGQPRS